MTAATVTSLAKPGESRDWWLHIRLLYCLAVLSLGHLHHPRHLVHLAPPRPAPGHPGVLPVPAAWPAGGALPEGGEGAGQGGQAEEGDTGQGGGGVCPPQAEGGTHAGGQARG